MDQVFPITPASGNVFWVLIPIEILLIGLAALFIYLGYSATHVQFEVWPNGLRISGGLYGKFVPTESLIPAQAREINLRSNSEHGIALKTNGINLPGYTAGWFRLSNGDKALVFVTDRSRVVYVPTQDGYAMILSPQDPQAFIASLQHAR
jgi:Bacterial PH domain